MALATVKPDAQISNTNGEMGNPWTLESNTAVTTDLWQYIDEGIATPNDANTDALSNVAGPVTKVLELGLGPIANVDSVSQVVVKIRTKTSGAFAAFTVDLKPAGGAYIGAKAITGGAGYTNQSLTFGALGWTAAQYDGAVLKITHSGSGGKFPSTVYVSASEADVTYTEGGGGAAALVPWHLFFGRAL